MSITYPPETTNGVVTSWIPLTTGWTDVPACSSRYVIYKYEPILGTQTISHQSTILNKSTFSNQSNISNQPTSSYLGAESTSAYVAYDPLQNMSINSHERCLPSDILNWRTQFFYDEYGEWQQDESLRTKISLLSLMCPNSWSTVATFIKLGISTQVMCCPP